MGSRGFQLTSHGPLRLYSTAELLNMPAPTWLIEPILPAGGLVGLYAAPGTGKSFVAIDMALSVACGIPWQGRPTQQGYVVYIGAEGGMGIGKRVRAWLQAHGLKTSKAKHIAWLVESIPLNADSEQTELLMERITDEIKREPSLVIVDTLARCFDGDENQQEDMGRFIAGVDLLRRKFNCTVLVVHHTRLGGDRERGNTAFRGAADAMISIAKENASIVLCCTKQKDAEEFEAVALVLQQVPGTDSCVVQADPHFVKLHEVTEMMFAGLQQIEPVKWDDWRTCTGLSQSQFAKGFHILQEAKRVKKVRGEWVSERATQ